MKRITCHLTRFIKNTYGIAEEMVQWFRILAAQTWEIEIGFQYQVKMCLEFSRYHHNQMLDSYIQ